MKKIKTIDISENDSQLYFTSTDAEYDDKTLYGIYTDGIVGNRGYWMYDASLFDNESIKKVQLGVESIGKFVITEDGHLYGLEQT